MSKIGCTQKIYQLYKILLENIRGVCAPIPFFSRESRRDLIYDMEMKGIL